MPAMDKTRVPGLVVALLGSLLFAACERPAADPSLRAEAGPAQVTALGRIVPGRAVIAVAAPPGDRVATLETAEGRDVEQGAVLALLATHELRRSELEAARVALAELRERLAAETVHGEAAIRQAEAALALAEAQLAFDRSELARVRSLVTSEAATGRRADEQGFVVRSRELSVERGRAELEMARAGLARTRAALGLGSAEARVKSAEAQLELAIIRAPLAGRVLKVFVHPGEQTGGGPILQLGEVSDMQVVAEVQTRDIGRVRVGQRAEITGESLPGPETGTVIETGEIIHKNDVLNVDPRAPRDTRVVEIRIRLDRREPAARLSNLEVEARVFLEPPGP